MATTDTRCRDVLDALGEGVVVHDANGQFETCNAAAERILGLTAAQMAGLEAVDPQWRAFREDGTSLAPESPAMVALRTGHPQTGLVIGIDKPDGTLTWASLESHPIARAGRPEGVVTVLADVTERRRTDNLLRVQKDRWQHDLAERKRVEEELRQRNRYIETILEQAPIGFAVHTIDDGVGRFVSARYEEIYGVPRGAIDSHFTFFDKVWPRDRGLRDEIRERVVADMSSGDPSRMHWENVPVPSATGETRYINAMNIPLLDQNLMVSTVQDVTDRVRAEEATRKSEALYRLLAENVSDLIWILDVEALRFRYVSPSVERLLGYAPEEVIEQGWIAAMFTAESAQTATRALVDGIEAFKRKALDHYTDNVELTRRDGSTVWVEFTARYVMNEASGHVEAYGVSRDITERRRAETERRNLWEELSQAQKMESIGRLAGGIAHDFNNILADIVLQVGLAAGRYPLMKPVFDELRADVDLASALIRQLLVFSRRSEIDVRPLDLNEVAANLLRMLGRLLGDNIRLQFERSQDPAAVEADAGMLEQVIMNLAVNARDAMPHGGSLTIRIEPVDLGGEGVKARTGIRPGRFVCLSASDTGQGMDEGTLARVFEPFFTTKKPGEGTGLGLSMVHGIVAQHRGWVEAESTLGGGSTFRVFLPAAAELVLDAEERAESTVLAGSETVLLVDDFAKLREKIAESLRMLGYEVLEAGTAEEGLRQWHEHHARIDMLFTDISLPGALNGLRLADRLRESKPSLKVILSSGYGDEVVDEARVAAGMVYLHKPCDIDTMARTIRECFGRP
jgi:PAS domain S-box-containing protein